VADLSDPVGKNRDRSHNRDEPRIHKRHRPIRSALGWDRRIGIRSAGRIDPVRGPRGPGPFAPAPGPAGRDPIDLTPPAVGRGPGPWRGRMSDRDGSVGRDSFRALDQVRESVHPLD
jgi:hypothetical protein